MKKVARLFALVFAAVMVISLVGCGPELAGRWKSTSDEKTQLAFSSLGKVTMSAEGIELTGTYTAEEGELEMVMTAPNGEVYIIEAKYEIDDNKLYLENSKGQIELFTR